MVNLFFAHLRNMIGYMISVSFVVILVIVYGTYFKLENDDTSTTIAYRPRSYHNSELRFIIQSNRNGTDNREYTQRLGPTCSSPVGNVVYIKTHKTGSTTVQSILYRYGLSRNLSFVMRRTNPHNGHIRHMKVTEDSPKEMFLPILSEGNECLYSGYNISAVHVVHKKGVFESFMNPGTKYITILRNPVSQLLSAVRFFNLWKKSKGNSTEERLTSYLKSRTWKSSSYGRNSQIFDLGLSKSHFENDTKVKLHVKRLAAEFDLVLIHEYFDESIVLLGRELCWDLEDLAYTIQNNRSSLQQYIEPKLTRKIKSFNRADVLLYEHFNKTLWSKIEAEGPSFWEDLEKFRQLQTEKMVRCFNSSTLNVRGMAHSSLTDYCDRYAGGLFLFKTLFKKQNKVCRTDSKTR